MYVKCWDGSPKMKLRRYIMRREEEKGDDSQEELLIQLGLFGIINAVRKNQRGRIMTAMAKGLYI